MPPAEVSSTTGSGGGRDPGGCGGGRCAADGHPAALARPRGRVDAPGSTYRHCNDSGDVGRHCPCGVGAGRRRLAGLDECRPSIRPSSPDSPDLSAALVALQKRALGVLAGLPADALELGELFRAAGHELALVGRSGAGRVPRPGVGGPRLHDVGDAGRDAGDPGRAGATRTGTSARSSARSAPAGSPVGAGAGRRRRRRGHHVPHRRVRPDVAASRRSRSATRSRATCRAATSRSTRWRSGCRT